MPPYAAGGVEPPWSGTRNSETLPSCIVTSWRMTSAIPNSRTHSPAVSTARCRSGRGGCDRVITQPVVPCRTTLSALVEAASAKVS